LHEADGKECSNEGLIILQVNEDKKAVDNLAKDVQAIGRVTVKTLEM
jgi:hypothetical protein